MLKRLYDWTMDKAAHRHATWWLAAFSFMESSFFPIPPHPLLGLMCLAKPEKALRFGLVCTLASVLGGILGYYIGYALEGLGASILSFYGHPDAMGEFQKMFAEWGLWIILIKGLTPIPYKFVTIASGFKADNDALPIRADARVLGATLPAGESLTLPLDPARHQYLVAPVGQITVNGLPVAPRDGVAITGESELVVSASEDAELVLVDAR